MRTSGEALGRVESVEPGPSGRAYAGQLPGLVAGGKGQVVTTAKPLRPVGNKGL